MPNRNRKQKYGWLKSTRLVLLFLLLFTLSFRSVRADESTAVSEAASESRTEESTTAAESSEIISSEESSAVESEESGTDTGTDDTSTESEKSSEETSGTVSPETSESGSEEQTSSEPQSESESGSEPGTEKESETEPGTEPGTEPSTEPEPSKEPVWPVSILYCPFAYEEITEDRELVIVTASQAYVRAEANLKSQAYATVRRQQLLEYLDSVKDSTGLLWFRVRIVQNDLEIEGYLASTMGRRATLSASGDPYENYLSLLGFSGSYLTDLKKLHEEHPSWTFLATRTGLNWADSLKEEANPSYYRGISLIHIESISSWKKLENNYDYASSSYLTNYDGPKWTLASDELVAYFLDPRNFLNDDGIYMFLNLLYDESQTVAGVEAIAKGSFLAGSVKDVDGTTIYYPQALYDIGRSLGINPYYLASSIRQEIGTAGTSKSISGTSTTITPKTDTNRGGTKLTGYYNYYNVYAYTMMGMDANDVGLWFASGQDAGYTSYNRPWNTRMRALIGGAQYHAYNYLLNYQNTLYYKKFNVVPGSGTTYRHQYMTNVMGAYSEARGLAQAYATLSQDQMLVFDIPIYENLPQQPAAKPTADVSPNNRLKALQANGVVLPELNLEDLEYSLAVTAKNLNLTAVPYNKTARVEGDGTLKLNEGENRIELKVTAENGDIRTYVLNIYLASDPGDLISTKLKLSDGVLSGFAQGQSPEGFLKLLEPAEGFSLRIKDASGRLKTSGTMGTGDKVEILAPNGGALQQVDVLLYGDVNGDGLIDMSDLIKIRNHNLGLRSIEGIFLQAADINADENVDMSDLIKVRNHNLGLQIINQER